MIEDLGLTTRIADKVTQYPNGGGVIDHVAEGMGTDVGLVPVTVIRNAESRGVRLVALPDAVQNYTSYTAVTASGADEAAADYVEFLATPRAREAFAATGVD
jgi:ABC-type molybdate transport system substrate-binding protein